MKHDPAAAIAIPLGGMVLRLLAAAGWTLAVTLLSLVVVSHGHWLRTGAGTSAWVMPVRM